MKKKETEENLMYVITIPGDGCEDYFCADRNIEDAYDNACSNNLGPEVTVDVYKKIRSLKVKRELKTTIKEIN